MKFPQLQTPRLILRQWLPTDREPFAALNADPRVVECLPGALTREQSDNLADRIESHFAERSFGLWAVEIKNVAPFVGFIGLAVPRFEAHFTARSDGKPCVEIGWRLASEHWNKGYATEGARAALDFGFNELNLNEIVSFTSPDNVRSRRVMEKLAMMHDPRDDFEHPNLPKGDRLRRHVLYRKQRG
jgi:RimJ/RimL family protein N-acetyltransferase